jgi:hypothetical protein
LKEFDSKVVARKYIELFNQILSFKKWEKTWVEVK